MSDDTMVGAVLEDSKEKMEKAITHTQSEFGSVRTGRASSVLVEKLRVEYYGSEVPLQQLASFSVPEARVLVITPFDKGAVKDIEKAIQNSDLGINPSSDGNVLRLTFPPLTEDRRKELVKIVKNKAEDGRIQIRNARRAARQDLDGLEKDGEIGKDDIERAEKELDKSTAHFVAEIDRMVQHKEQELLEV